MATGTVKSFNSDKGTGILIEDGEANVEIFVHHTAVTSSGFMALEQGQRVEFEITQSSRGPQAANVRIL